jgi:N-acetyl-gamma-glutamyl-phosphate reductase
MVVAAVAGASGYAGGELLRLLLTHPDMEIGPIAAASNAGEPVASVHPHLQQLADRRFDALDAEALAEADIVFLALPHGASGNVAREITQDVPIVDLGADHRLGDQARWSGYYPGEWAGSWTYGLPELPHMRDRIAASARVASPGCYPTGVILGLSPLLAAGMAEPDDVVVVAASGTSGAGRSASVKGLAAEVMGAMSTYKVGGSHQHTPEMEQALSWAAGSDTTVSFTPMLAPMPRGILAVTTAPAPDGVTTELARDVMFEAYLGEPFVTVLPPEVWPTTAATLGANTVHLQVAVDSHASRIVVVSAIDNLVKGAAGQALQNANLMLGFAETAGLPLMGLAP